MANVRWRDKVVRTLTPRQAWPRNMSLGLYKPEWMPILTRSPFPSNVMYGHPRSIDRTPFVPPVPVNVTPPLIVATDVIPTAICSLETPGTWQNQPEEREYQWIVNDVEVDGETDPDEFDTTELSAGDVIVLQETATNARGSGVALSNPIILEEPEEPEV